MKSDEAALYHDVPKDLAIHEIYRLLNARRIEIDERITSHAGDDSTCESDWKALDVILVELRRLVSRLARSEADGLFTLRGKADVLRTLLQHEEPDGGPDIPDSERSALAVSLATDVLRLPKAFPPDG